MIPPCKRGQVGHDRSAVGSDQSVEGGEHALVQWWVGAEVLALDGDQAVAQLEGRHRVVADEAVAAPPFAVFHRLEQEAVTFTDQLQVGRDRRLEVRQHLGPHRHHRVFTGQRPELLAAGPHVQRGHRPGPKERKKQVYSPVWQAPLPSCSTRNRRVSPSQS